MVNALPLIFGQTHFEPVFHNFSTNDGLASSEVYDAIQDKNGYMWFITDNGLSRYDGYEFKNYDITDGLSDNVITQIRKGKDGELWFNSLSLKVFSFDGTSFHPYKYQYILSQYNGLTANGADFTIDTIENKFIFGFNECGILEIDTEGKYVFNGLEGKIGFWIKKVSNRLISIEVNHKYNLLYLKNNKPTLPRSLWHSIYWEENKHLIKSDSIKGNQSAFHELCQIGVDSALVIRGQSIFLLYKGKILKEQQFPQQIIKIIQDKQKHFWICLNNQGGLLGFNTIRDLFSSPPTQMLNGNTISSAYLDIDDNLWVTTLNNGVWLCRNFDIQKSIFFKNTSIEVFETMEDLLLIGTKDGSLYALKKSNADPKLIQKVDKNSASLGLVYSKKNKTLYYGGFKYQNVWTRQSTLNYGQLYLTKDESQLICLSVNAYIFDSKKEDLLFASYPNYLLRILCTAQFGDKIVFGSINGLHILQGDSLPKLNPNTPQLNQRIEDIAVYNDSTLILAIKGQGLYFYKDSILGKITKKDGLTSNMIESIRITSDNTIWALTQTGLNKITKSADGVWACEKLTVQNGLPSNEVTDLIEYEGKIWLATTNGIAIMPHQVKQKTTHKPILKEVLLDGQLVEKSTKLVIEPSIKNIEIAFLSPTISLAGHINYRFRLNESDAWAYTSNPKINFSSLKPTTYTLEIQASGDNLLWSPSFLLPLHVKKPFWQRWYVWGFALLCALALLYFLIKTRIKRLQKTVQTQIQMLELERSALQARMNPHFLYNCLNSIQSMILNGDKLNTMRYLSKFSKLMRFNLESYNQGTILLSEEIQFLENYLNLEKLRLGDGFTYAIEIDSDIFIDQQEIPPMLIQPFVENSILHGIVPNNGVGHIQITCTPKDDYLLVCIQDNGVGLGVFEKNKEKHNSIAIDLAKNRLKLYNQNQIEHPISISNIENNNVATGVRVELFIWKNL